MACSLIFKPIGIIDIEGKHNNNDNNNLYLMLKNYTVWVKFQFLVSLGAFSFPLRLGRLQIWAMPTDYSIQVIEFYVA